MLGCVHQQMNLQLCMAGDHGWWSIMLYRLWSGASPKGEQWHGVSRFAPAMGCMAVWVQQLTHSTGMHVETSAPVVTMVG
jgi:hypothetical protein